MLTVLLFRLLCIIRWHCYISSWSAPCSRRPCKTLIGFTWSYNNLGYYYMDWYLTLSKTIECFLSFVIFFSLSGKRMRYSCPKPVSDPPTYCIRAAGVLRYNRESDNHRMNLTTFPQRVKKMKRQLSPYFLRKEARCYRLCYSNKKCFSVPDRIPSPMWVLWEKDSSSTGSNIGTKSWGEADCKWSSQNP